MKGKIIASLLLLAAFSCNKANNQPEEVSKYFDDGRAKACVAIASVIDSSSSDVNWNLSDEFTNLIKEKVNTKANLFLSTNIENEISTSKNPFSSDISWVKDSFRENDFVVFAEIIQHKNIPVSKKNQKEEDDSENITKATNLDMSIRIRIIDVRGNTPKIILQEKISDTMYLPKSFLKIDYDKITWGTNEYQKTPLFIAHNSFTKDISARINEYIILAKNR